jgi:hypothetical protein
MGELANAFSSSGIFDLVSLTKAVNRIPTTPTHIGDMGIFAPKGIKTTTAVIEEMNSKIALVAETQRGGPGVVVSPAKRTARPISVGHIQVDGGLDADDILGVRAFGSESQEQVWATKVNDELAAMKTYVDVTREYRRVNALHGQILDADGSTVLTNLFTEFGITETTVDFAFTTATTDIRGKCLDVKREIDKGIGGSAVVTEVRAICGATWFDALTSHATVKAAYDNWEAAADRLGGDMRKGFTFGGITFEEYTATVSGNAFVNASQARFFPIGQGLYEEYFAPADYVEAVGTIGQEFYAKSALRKMEKGIDLEVQSNPLPIAFFPLALVKGTQS